MSTPEYNFNWPVSEPALLPYANGVQVVFSQWDFQFLFSQLSGAVTENPEVPQQQSYLVSRLIMSPHHAKAFLKVLSSNLAIYEREFGEIPDLLHNEGGETP